MSTDERPAAPDAPRAERVRDPSFAPAHPATALPHLGTYRRRLPVSLERLYENALDWAHLPHLHASSFAAIECFASGPWGFRARVTSASGAPATIELELDRASRRWITRTLDGRNEGSEVWTHAFPIERRRTDIVVDFFVPGLDASARPHVAAAYAALYARLYDEDVAMMVERERKLDARIDGASGPLDVALGPLASLALPLEAAYRGRSFVIARLGDGADAELVAYTPTCPHRLGPLPHRPDAQGAVRCPWHGHRFDVRTGECLSGAPCRLPPAPRVVIDTDGAVRLVARG